MQVRALLVEAGRELAAAGVPDALNSAIHGHSQKVAYSNYLAPVSADAAEAARVANGLVESAPRLRLVD